jgi:hypothetical protein
MGGRPMAELVQVVQARYPIKTFQNISKHFKTFQNIQNIPYVRTHLIPEVTSSNLCIKPRVKCETQNTPKSAS